MQIDKEYLQFASPDSRNKYQKNLGEEESSFKAWDADSIMPENNVNLLRNFKSQLINYQQRYQKQNPVINSMTIKLPSLQKLQRKMTQKSANNLIKSISQTKPLSQRKNRQVNKQHLIQYKSIQVNGKSLKTLKLKKQNQTLTNKINLIKSKQDQGIKIAKVHQMRFQQNVHKKRIRKRDIYLSIFGQRGKNKVQKITFDDQNKPYQICLENKNQSNKETKDQKENKQNYLGRSKTKYSQNFGRDLIKSTGIMRY